MSELSHNSNRQPAIRFKDFTDPWEQRKLGEGMYEYTDRVYIDDNKNYNQVSVKNIGKITLRGVQIGKKIGRKRQAKVNLTEHPNTLIFTRQTIEQGGIGFAPNEVNGAIVTENMPTIDVNIKIFDKPFLLSFFNTIQFRENVIRPNIEGGTAQVSVHEDNIIKSIVLVPKIKEQQKIGELLEKSNNLIALHQRKVEVLQNLKKALLQRMFASKDNPIPDIRFAGFTDPWEQRKLRNEVSDIGTGKSSFTSGIEKSTDNPYAVLGSTSVISYDKEFDYSGDFILTARVGANAGTLYKYSGNTKISDNTVYIQAQNLDFVYFLLTNFDLKRLSFGTGQPLLKASELKSLKITFPKDKDERQEIGYFFKQLDATIALHQRKVEVLQDLKKALLQKMFI